MATFGKADISISSFKQGRMIADFAGWGETPFPQAREGTLRLSP
jgi:hypothetical protein